MTTPKILIILGSTRQNRQGEAVARWLMNHARQRADAIFELLDLRDWPQPFLESPMPPAMGRYDAATHVWAEMIDPADGFVFITPEYNHGYPAVLKNALDLLYHEWGHKPAAIVSYGATGAGYRAAEQLRQVLVELRMVPVREQVGIAAVWMAFDKDGEPNDANLAHAADAMLDELVWWATTLKPAREQRQQAAALA